MSAHRSAPVPRPPQSAPQARRPPVMDVLRSRPALLSVCALALAAVLFYLPYLPFDKALVGSDDSRRGWHSTRDLGHGYIQVNDRWSPHNGGTSIMEQRYGSFISPMYPLHYLFPRYVQRTIEFMFWTFTAGVLMWLYLLTVGVPRSIALVFGIGFMLAPGLLSNIFTGHYVKMEVISLLPGLMIFTERMLRRVSLLDMIGLPAVMALVIYSRHLQLAYFSFVGMGAYFAARMLYGFLSKKTPLGDALKRTSVFAAALLVGALITSMNYVPSMHHAEKTSKRAGGVDYEYAASFALNPEEVVSFVEPDFVGWAQFYWGRNALKLNSEYFGVLIVLLAVMLFVIRKQSFDRWLLAGLALVALLFALGANTPFHRLLYGTLPGIKNFRAPSMVYIWVYFPCFVLAAFALEELLKLDWWGDARLRKRLLIYGGIVGGLSLVYMLGSKPISEWWYQSILPVDVQSKGKFQALEAHLPQLALGGFLVFAVVAGFLGATFARLNGHLGRNAFLAILGLLLVIDLARVSYPYMTQTARSHNFFARQEAWERSVGDFITKQDKGVFRVHSMLGDQKMYIPGIDLTYIFDDFTDQQYNDVVQQALMYTQAMQRAEYASNPAVQVQFRNLLSFLNAKYILSPSPLTVPGFQEIISSGGFRIYRNLACFPRMYLAPQIVPSADPKKDLFERFTSPDFAPTFAIVDAKDRSAASQDTTRDTTATDSVAINLYDIRQGRIKAEVRSSRGQMLVIAENNSPGWTATLNNAPAPILDVNYAWKGILVPKGTSMVELKYDSQIAEKWRKVTLISSILYGLLALGVLGMWVVRRRSTGKG